MSLNMKKLEFLVFEIMKNHSKSSSKGLSYKKSQKVLQSKGRIFGIYSEYSEQRLHRMAMLVTTGPTVADVISNIELLGYLGISTRFYEG